MQLRHARRTASRALAAVSLLLAAPAHASLVYDLSSHLLGDPDGPWSYAYAGPAGRQTFPTFTAPTANRPIAVWWDAGQPASGNVAQNASDGLLALGSSDFAPFQHAAHPGGDGAVADYVFTAPFTGRYRLNARLSGLDFIGPTATQVAVALDEISGAALFTGEVEGFAGSPLHAAFGGSPQVGFSDSLWLDAGGRVCFEVGFDLLGRRPTGPYANDAAGVSVEMALGIPEVPALVMTLLGFASLGLAGLRTSRRRPDSPSF